MKKITLLLLIFSCSIFSQTLQMPDIPSDGIVYETTTLNAFLDLSSNGPWDFSNLNPVDQSDIVMQPIENSSYSTTVYPNTTHIKSFMSGDQSVIQFPGFSENGYSYNGENSIIVNNYATPLILHPYPFSVGDSHTDEVNNIPFTCPICPPAMFRNHEITSQAVGSGSVIMPDGTTYENVVLVNHVAIFTDAQTGSSPCITTRNSYFLWAEDLGIPIVETFNQVSEGACPPASVQFSRFYTGQSELVTSCPDEYELPVVWRENFECEAPFAINDFNSWISIDGDQGITWGASDADFTNEGYVGTGIVWNHDQATPANPGGSIDGYAPYEGSQGLYFFASGASQSTIPNDDWMIGPEFTIDGVSSPMLSFWAKSITDQYGLDRFRIGIGSSTNPDDFTIITPGNYVEAPIEWTQYEYDLSEFQGQTVRVGIHCVSNDSFVLMMDSFKVEGTLGLIEANSLEISVYPNPVEGNFVTIHSPYAGTKEIEVFDVSGKKVIDTYINGSELDVSSFNRGFYLLKVTIQGKTKVSKLIVK